MGGVAHCFKEEDIDDVLREKIMCSRMILMNQGFLT